MKEILARKMSQFGSREEKYNFTREFLQELILQIIDRKGYFKNLAFVGGTALRVLYGLHRFSEDLDFSLINKKGFDFASLLKALKRELELNGFSIEEAKGKDRIVLSEFIRFKGLLHELGLSSQKNEKLFVKLEIDSNPPEGFETEVAVVNRNFLFKARSYGPASLFASKLHAILFRKYEKGRDYYDLLWFLARGTAVNYRLLSNAAAQTAKKSVKLDAPALKELLISKIGRANFPHILRDVRPFLEKKEEAEYFRKEYFISAIERYFQ
ncbi:MAG: nucleotidyl transferase AbiEii/AbiGii toxin family protein [bacterium]